MKFFIICINIFILNCSNQYLFAQNNNAIPSSDNINKENIQFQKYTFSDSTIRIYKKSKLKDFITKIPKDFLDVNKDFVAKDHAWYLCVSTVATIALLPVDQQINDQTRAWADQIGLSPNNSYGKIGPLKIIPQNIGAGLYLIGNGTTVILISSGFATYGLLKNDYRAQATASGLMESLLLSGVFTQTIKRLTGRESPYIAKENGHSGGQWNPFPGFGEYMEKTPYYDAVPSGHLTTIFAALTVITTNYPEYKWIKPVGYTLLAGMCFQMVQSEVHWVSDYPLALFLGYFIGKTVAQNRFTEIKDNSKTSKKVSYNFTASRQFGYNTFGLVVKFK